MSTFTVTQPNHTLVASATVGSKALQATVQPYRQTAVSTAVTAPFKRRNQRLKILQTPLLNPVELLLKQARTVTQLNELDVYEQPLLQLAAAQPSTFFPALWQELAKGTLASKQLAAMVLLRSGSEGRNWVKQQLTLAPCAEMDAWLLNFLKHHFSV